VSPNWSIRLRTKLLSLVSESARVPTWLPLDISHRVRLRWLLSQNKATLAQRTQLCCALICAAISEVCFFYRECFFFFFSNKTLNIILSVGKFFHFWIRLILTIFHFTVPFETPRPEMLYNSDRWKSNCVPQNTNVPQTYSVTINWRI